jgi:hypothetical protein
MNDRIQAIIEHCDFHVGNEHYEASYEEKQRIWIEAFSKLLIQECAENLEFHGHEDALSQLRWHAQSKYSIILD